MRPPQGDLAQSLAVSADEDLVAGLDFHRGIHAGQERSLPANRDDGRTMLPNGKLGESFSDRNAGWHAHDFPMLLARADGAAEEAGRKHFTGDVADGERVIGAGAVDVLDVARVVDTSDYRHVGRRITADDSSKQRGVVGVQR